jgi:broad specificity phosphatase PhoE
VLLARHSVPEVDRSIPASEWRLSAEGRARCDALAERVAAHDPELVVASIEPKALETAELLAARLGLEVRESAELREQERRTVGWLERDELEAAIRRLFMEPDRVVFGEESAAAALTRFSRAVEGLGDGAVVVSHGTVISLYVAAQTGRDAFELWQSLELPDLLVV